MSRAEFMKELEYLIQDIPEEDKADALQYYRDYLDEAGEDREEECLKEFGSPERIAAMIRSDLAGNLSDGGEFTDKGYGDERFRDPNYQMARRYDLPDVSEEKGSGEKAPDSDKKPPRTSTPLKIVLWIALIVVAFPFLAGIGGGVIGILSGLGAALLAIVVTIGALTFAFIAAGVALVVFGIVTLVVNPLEGMLILGLGILFMGIGLLFLVVAILFYGRFLPFLFRSVLDVFNRLFHKERKVSK